MKKSKFTDAQIAFVLRQAEAGGEPRIELIGERTAMLRAAGVSVPLGGAEAGLGRNKGPRAGAVGPDLFVCSVKVDAGTRNRRCQYITVAV